MHRCGCVDAWMRGQVRWTGSSSSCCNSVRNSDAVTPFQLQCNITKFPNVSGTYERNAVLSTKFSYLVPQYCLGFFFPIHHQLTDLQVSEQDIYPIIDRFPMPSEKTIYYEGTLSRQRRAKVYGHRHPHLHYSAASIMDNVNTQDLLPFQNRFILHHYVSNILAGRVMSTLIIYHILMRSFPLQPVTPPAPLLYI